MEPDESGMIDDIWKTNLPREWKTGNVIALPKPKRGYRTLALQASAYNVYAKIFLQTRIRDQVKEYVTSSQNGFVAGRSAVDAIHRVERYRETAVEYNRNLKPMLLNFSMAFDKVKHSAMIAAFCEMGLPAGYCWRILEIVRQCRMQTQIGKSVLTANGTRQDCCLSPSLFICVMAMVTRNLKYVHIEYADDLGLVLLPEDKKEGAIREIKTIAEPLGLYLNESRTEVMELSRES